MKQIGLIFKREYLTRVRKKSFIVMTILGPLLVALFYGGLIFIVTSEETPEYHVLVYEEGTHQLFTDDLKRSLTHDPSEEVFFHFEPLTSFQEGKTWVQEGRFDAILRMPEDPLRQTTQITLHYTERPPLPAKAALELRVEKILEEYKAAALNVSPDVFDAIRERIRIPAYEITADGEDKNDDTALRVGVGFAGGFLIYIFILLYGIQVLRGVMEEKTNRIVEVMISSVKPFQLMLGKILGVGMVGLTQFIIWVILSSMVMSGLGVLLAPSVQEQMQAGNTAGTDNGAVEMLGMITGLPYGYLIPAFLFFFLGGYLLYSSLFAAVGAAIDADSDSQQFMMPVTLPLVFSIALASFGIKNPDGPISVFFSIFPLTSPVVMMTRIPFEPPLWQIIASVVSLILAFLGTTWLAGKIYRTGILMYGKKVTYKELWKWLRHY
jgi:ABC-2 type transport system permease protein